MSRINDVGGMQGFPAIEREFDEPAFHADWEAHVFAINRALLGQKVYNLDEFRDAIERMGVAEYLGASYYERWLHAIIALLAEKGMLTEQELAGLEAPGLEAPGLEAPGLEAPGLEAPGLESSGG